jgi:hypothetical protein
MPGGRTRPDGGAWPLSGDARSQATDVRAYAEAGLDELMLSLAPGSVPDLVANLRKFMRDVVPRV